jgi:hypothetical protein
MGMKAINAKREELTKTWRVKQAFVDSAQELKAELAKVEKGLRELDAIRARIQKDISGLETFGIKEFVDYKASLMAISNGSSEHFAQLTKMYTRPLPIAPLNAVVQGMEAEVRKMLDGWIEKHTATFPKELKVGMTLKGQSGELVEILKVDSSVGRCDVKINYKGNQKTENKIMAALTPKYGYKYIAA